eukprot:7874708-Ditylum_brightwellii.AAC.1
MRTLTTSNEDGTNIHQTKQPGRQTGDYSIPKTCPEAVGERPAYKLRTTPADATLPIYKLSIPFFDEGAPEEWIKFLRGLAAVLKGQNVTQGLASYAVANTLLKGNALTVFKQVKITCENQTVPHFDQCLDDVAKHIFLEKAGQIQKRYMQRNICFGKDLTVKE